MLKKNISFLVFLWLSLTTYSQTTLTGSVTDANSGEPLSGAHITITPSLMVTVSRPDGSFHFNRLKPGPYDLTISYLGYSNQTLKIEIPAKNPIKVAMVPDQLMQDEYIVTATRIGEMAPAAVKTIAKKEISQMNVGNDLPYLIQNTPSLVTSSDAGAGVGYTSFRIRGTDMSRINVMVNGIPLNDPESNQVYWVDLPDIASSTDEIQVQRGVATSVYGNSAFGAGVNLVTANPSSVPYLQIASNGGSFNTYRNYVRFGTGMLSNRISLEGRLSHMTSDGYVDRASAKLKSFFLSGGYYGQNTMFKVNVFSGYERTYQAWNGTPSDSLSTNRTYNPSGEYTGPDGKIKYYQDEVDDYQQDHYQFFFSHVFSNSFSINAALHYTHGFGYYENYKSDKKFSSYGFNNVITGTDTIKRTDIIQRKYLENDFIGATASAQYKVSNKLVFNFGTAFNHYDGDHYGTILWAKFYPAITPGTRWYEGNGIKKELNTFLKTNWLVSSSISLYTDLQFRTVNHSITGYNDDLRDLTQKHDYNFFNPKVGFSWSLSQNHRLWASVGIAHREPSRSDFKDADPDRIPSSEKLIDYEIGYNFQYQIFKASTNLFYMDYTDQLVLTGKINNVGDPVMINVPNSFRAGIEVSAEANPIRSLLIGAHATLSSNKIKNFVSYVDNWDTYVQRVDSLGETDLSFSPALTAGAQVKYEPFKGFTTTWYSRYVGKQFIDNTSSDERSLDAYFVNDLNMSYSFKTSLIKEIRIWGQVNNIFDVQYESNAWIYRYISEGKEYKMDGYFAQAGINFMAGITLNL